MTKGGHIFYALRSGAVAETGTSPANGNAVRQLCGKLALAWSRVAAQFWWAKVQHAALPFRWRDDGSLEIMLVTSRGTGRWIIPKGWPKKGRAPYVTAAQEAIEEGGLLGNIYDKPLGTYRYEKQHVNFALPCEVTVFALEVMEQMREWPERRERSTRWFEVCDAATAVQEPELAALILDLAAKAPGLNGPIDTVQFLTRKQKPRH